MTRDADEEVPVTACPHDLDRIENDEVVADEHERLCVLVGGSEALRDRRQRAREAGQDHLTDHDAMPGIEAAIETATRVRVTREIQLAAAKAYPFVDNMITAAFRAAGFEVEE